ncbi:MAG: polysaccharide biosynthesis/export family protein [Acidobacteriota bacterium]|nr:polysaccharide biosynthesis/export family protein [Acidobacteriota bacterium]
MRLLLLAMLMMPLWNLALGQSYPVGPGDLLRINVLELEQITGDFRVDENGNLLLPLLKEVGVKDRTLLQIRNLIGEQLMKGGFVNSPQVFVDIVEVVYKPIRVIGAVKQPGKITSMSPDMNILDALAEVGGLMENADDEFVVKRKGPAGITNKTFKYSELIKEDEKDKYHPVLPGDTIAVPVKRPIIVSILGEVNRQGQMIFGGVTEVTILRVIAAAGGFTDYAKRGSVKIHRYNEEKEGVEVIEVDVRRILDRGKNEAVTDKNEDIEIKHDDVVIVP